MPAVARDAGVALGTVLRSGAHGLPRADPCRDGEDGFNGGLTAASPIQPDLF